MKKAATILVTMIILASCGQVQTTPAAEPTLVVPTVTSAPTDISIPFMAPTSTLEPWMRSLPEGVVTVEVEDEQIVGLDADGNQAMVYSLNTGEWETLTEQAPVEEVKDRPIELIDSSSFQNVATANGIRVSGLFGIDTTLSSKGVKGLEVPDALGADLVANIAWTVYSKHAKNVGAILDEASFKDKWLKLQAGESDPSELAVNLCDYVASNIGPNSKQKCRTAVFFPGEGAARLDSDEKAVNIVNIYYVNGVGRAEQGVGILPREDMPDYDFIHEAGYGFELVFDEVAGELNIKLGPSYLISDINKQYELPTVTAAMFKCLELNDGETNIEFRVGNSYYNTGMGYLERGFEVE